MTAHETTDMTCTHALEQSLQLDSGILTSTTWTVRFASCRRYSTKQLGNCAGADLFDRASDGPASKLSRKAVIRSPLLGVSL
ncbi:hypothetical protein CV770_40125 [Bradyrhizobium sp. AC87j1]|nr:hypothetical protein CV770_40125 [Bradyrhizobium sp. AC87j1]